MEKRIQIDESTARRTYRLLEFIRSEVQAVTMVSDEDRALRLAMMSSNFSVELRNIYPTSTIFKADLDAFNPCEIKH